MPRADQREGSRVWDGLKKVFEVSPLWPLFGFTLYWSENHWRRFDHATRFMCLSEYAASSRVKL
jgi:hypothetical protein